MIFRFIKEDNIFKYMCDDTVIYQTKELSILIDSENSVLIKHGIPDVVENYFHKICSISKNMIILRGEKFRVKELDKLINISGYTKRFLKNLRNEFIMEYK